ncbi:MAG: VCBS repeat-containing protein, partial [Sphingomonadales bacterium]
KLVVSGLLAEDRVSVAANNGITVSGSTVSYDGAAIGTISGGTGGTFTLQFNSAATTASTQAALQALTYANVSDTPTAARTLVVNVFDGAGGQLSPTYAEQTGANNPFASYSTQRSAASFADIDNDGDQDMIVGSASNGLAVYRNNGNGSYTPLSGSANPLGGIATGNLSTTAWADLNGDGRADMVLGADNVALRTFTQNANGSFTEVTGAANPFNGVWGGYDAAPTFLDYDGDGDKDMVLGNYGGDFRTFRNNGNGSFTELTGTANPFNGLNVADSHSKPAGVDFDNDGDIDMVSGSRFSGLVSFRNNGDGTFTKLSAAENPYASVSLGQISAPAFTDLNGDGIADAVFGSDVGTLRTFTSLNGVPVVVNVTAQNDAPVAVADTVNALVGVTKSIAVLANDTDGDGDVLSILSTTAAGKGSVSIVGTTINYTSNAGVSGTDTFTYTTKDASGATSTATVTVNLDRPPVAVADTYTINAGATAKLNVTTNDTDPDNDAITLTGASTPLHGSVVVNADNTLSYTPTTGYTGTDTFTYTISDGKGGTATGTVNLTVKVPETAVAPTLVVGSDTVLVPTEGAAMKTSLTLQAGDVVTFDWNFTTDDYAPYKDFAFATVNGRTYSLSNTQATGDYGATGWNTFTFTADTAGTYVLGQGVMNDKDTAAESYLAVDAIRINGAIVQSFETGFGTTQVVGQVTRVTSGSNTHAPVTTMTPTNGAYEAFLVSQPITGANLESFLGLTAGSLANVAKSIGNEYQPIIVPIGVKIAANAHPDETYVTISGAPVGSVFNHGVYNSANNTWKVDIADLGGNLTITAPSDYVGSFTLSVVATSKVYGSNTTANSAAQSQVVNVAAASVEVYAPVAGGATKGGTLADILHAGVGIDTITTGTGNDTLIFAKGTAHGDTVVDFNGNGAAAGDILRFDGYDADATFTQIDATHWQVNHNGGTSHDVITFSNGAAIHASDFAFVNSTPAVQSVGLTSIEENMAIVTVASLDDESSMTVDDGSVGIADQLATVSVASLLEGELAASTDNGDPAEETLPAGPVGRADLIGAHIEATTVAETMRATSGDDVFVFHAGTAAGDHVLDFQGVASEGADKIEFTGFSADAVFTQIDETHWQIDYNAGAQHEVIVFDNATPINAQDFTFV